MSIVTEAVRAGLLYERRGRREIAVVDAREHPVIVEPIERFRGAIYGDVPAVRGGLHVHSADPKSFHVLLLEQDALIGCARYDRGPMVELGGFCVLPDRRGGRAAYLIVEKVLALAAHFEDKAGVARASLQFGSASILKKCGGRVVRRYWDEDHRRDVEILTFER